jgi:hypothetical protein
MTVLITLTLAGTDVGPFDLYSDADGYITPFETGVSRSALVAGYTSTLVPEGSTQVLAQSTGVCVRDLYMSIEGAPTTTTSTTSSSSTTTTTTTAIPTTVQLDWSVGNQSGGELIIFDNAMSIILDITSTAGSVQSGTIYLSLSELPYTIRGQWVSGSGNIIRYNICDIIGGGLIYTSDAIDIATQYEDYLVSPTPLYALVSLRAQNILPPSCPVA